MELDLREGRTAEFYRGRIHGCCGQGTMEHMTTCHSCGQGSPTLRGEVMYDANVGEPVCKNCGTNILNQHQLRPGERRPKLRPWSEQ